MFVKIRSIRADSKLATADDQPSRHSGNFIDTQQLAKERIQLLAHVKLNQHKRNIQNFKNCLIDSSYTNASDPNSMRDLGMVRNVQYSLGIDKPVYT